MQNVITMQRQDKKQEVIFLVNVLIEIQEQIKLKNTIKREIEKTIVLADKYTEA